MTDIYVQTFALVMTIFAHRIQASGLSEDDEEETRDPSWDPSYLDKTDQVKKNMPKVEKWRNF